MRFLCVPSFLILLFVLPACELITDTPKEPAIEWIEDSFSVKGNYLMGGFAGYGFKGQFRVLGESGDVEIAIQVKGQNESQVSATYSVISGETYEVRVVGDVDGSNRDTKPQDCYMRVVFSSPNTSVEIEKDLPSYHVSDGFLTYYFCPESLAFGEIFIE